MNALLVKMSSLGDIVHTLPAVADAARQGVRLDWAVEESYQPLAALAPGVDQVLPAALRRWRRAPLGSLRKVARQCPLGHRRCLSGISAEEAWARCRPLLDRPASNPHRAWADA